MIKPDDKVLIAFTGNQSSITLLHLLKLGVNEQIHKRFKFHPVILFIDGITNYLFKLINMKVI